MRAHLENAFFGALDYLALPVCMLAASPLLLRHLGVPAFGVWFAVMAATSAGSLLASGFGDAVVQRIAAAEAQSDAATTLRLIRAAVLIHLVLGAVLALLLVIASPLLSASLVAVPSPLRLSCLHCLDYGAMLLLVRAVENVAISTQRAFAEYGAAVRVSVMARLLTLGSTVLLAMRGHGLESMMVATVAITAGGMLAQFIGLAAKAGGSCFVPLMDRVALRSLCSFGAFSWLQALAGVAFSQLDRLIIGASLGSSALAYYGVCVQVAQPIHGFAAAALHFLFPYFAGHHEKGERQHLRRAVGAAIFVNLLFVAVATAVLLACGPYLLAAWMGPAFARHVEGVLPVLICGFAFLGMNVAGHYALLALGYAHIVTWVNLAGGAAMLAAMAWLVPSSGLMGAARARLFYGPLTWCFYLLLARVLRGGKRFSQQAPRADLSMEKI